MLVWAFFLLRMQPATCKTFRNPLFLQWIYMFLHTRNAWFFMILFATCFGIAFWWVLASMLAPFWYPFGFKFNILCDRLMILEGWFFSRLLKKHNRSPESRIRIRESRSRFSRLLESIVQNQDSEIWRVHPAMLRWWRRGEPKPHSVTRAMCP